MTSSPAGGRRVVVVTGGGGGIGAAIAAELGRRGDHVVTVDPLVTLDGTATLPAPEETTAGRIIAAGGSARATAISVADREAVTKLFQELRADHGRLDAVVNVAGITRPTGFARGAEEDWGAVLAVHLDGYRNVLEAALPIMAAAGRGRILGVTSGSGWRPADAGAYGCAKRAVASLTWQLGRVAPPGVGINAISPIAVTRMVTAALARASGGSDPSSGRRAATGGLSLDAMPEPDDLAPLSAHLVGEGVERCRGQVVFAGGTEVAVVEPPRLLEVVSTGGAASIGALVDAALAGAFVPAESRQLSVGGGNPRFDADYRGGSSTSRRDVAPTGRTCGVVSDRAGRADAVASALQARGVRCAVVAPSAASRGFAGAAQVVAALADRLGPLDSVVVALDGAEPASAPTAWEAILADHTDIADQIHADAAWARAVADHAAVSEREVRVVTLTDAHTPSGRTRAQAWAQLARAARGATAERVTAFAVALEDRDVTVEAGELAASLATNPDATGLSGAELAVGPGWVGLRSHPRPVGSIALAAPALPPWFDTVLGEIVDAGEVSG